jgi:hypothetical protein
MTRIAAGKRQPSAAPARLANHKREIGPAILVGPALRRKRVLTRESGLRGMLQCKNTQAQLRRHSEPTKRGLCQGQPPEAPGRHFALHFQRSCLFGERQGRLAAANSASRSMTEKRQALEFPLALALGAK